MDPQELLKLETAFRSWSEESARRDVKLSRKKILIIFLLIRYAGARLNEALGVDLSRDIDPKGQLVRLGCFDESSGRSVHVSAGLIDEMAKIAAENASPDSNRFSLRIDEGHVRRKFYERSVSCGLPRELGAPQAVRRARAVELMKNNVPLPVVQRILGQSSPNLTASLVSFSEEEIRQVTKHFVEKESSRKTSARNTFFGKIHRIVTGDVQSLLELRTFSGDPVFSVITNNSLSRLGLRSGSLATAEVKAPWVVIHKSSPDQTCSSDNIFNGRIARILDGRIVSEITVRIHDGTEICSLMTAESLKNLELKESDEVWASFGSFSVIIHVD